MATPGSWRLLERWERCPVTAVTGVLAIGVSLLWWGGRDIGPLLEDPFAARGEPWRLVTSALPHADALHLVFNLYWLAVLGLEVENAFGPLRTLGIYLLLAAGSSAWQAGLSGAGVGLSGVGYGLLGMLWMLDRHDHRFRNILDEGTTRLFAGWFLLCCVLTWLGLWRVGNVAHGAGAALGLLLGRACAREGGRGRIPAALGTALLLALGIAASTLLWPGANFAAPPGMAEGVRGCRALEAHRDEEALRWLREATALAPGNAVLRYDLGIARQRLHRNREALEDYRAAARLDPGFAPARKAAEELQAWLDRGGR